jgi:glutamate/tyrosine decarboxylase-like PLP-dependent enzyme
MTRQPHPLARWDPSELRRVAHRVADMVADYLDAVPRHPVFEPVPADAAQRFQDAPPPRGGAAADDILDEFAATVARYPFGNGHPRFWAWVNSPPAVIGVFAEALAAAMNPSVAGGNHAAVHVERQVVRWFAELLGLPDSAMGLLVSGGSTANMTALAAARHARAGFDVRSQGLQQGSEPLVVYMSAEGHGCIRKSVELLGIGTDALRVIPVNARYEMRVDALAAAIEADLRAGLRPIAVVANAGTVNTGAIDPIAEIAHVCREGHVWLHVDGAYGAAAILSPRYRGALDALRFADSVALDPHKWLYVPIEAGLVLVRDGDTLRSAFSLVPPYLRTDGDPSGVGGPPWFSEYGFQQSRGFRALKVWMALKYFGLDGYASAIDHDIELAGYLARRVSQSTRLELMAPPSLSIVCFRVVPSGESTPSGDELDRINKSLLERLQLSGRAFLSSTVLNGRFVLRACVVNPLSTEADIDAMLEALVELADTPAENPAARAGTDSRPAQT